MNDNTAEKIDMNANATQCMGLPSAAILGDLTERSPGDIPGPAERVDLRTLWEDLSGGSWQVEQDFFQNDRCYFVLRAARKADAHVPARARNFRILQRVLLEGGQKRVASEFELSTSTIAAISKQCLTLMGLSPPCSRVSPLLVMAAYAYEHRESGERHKACAAQHEQADLRVVTAVRPDTHVERLLTPAEYAVTRLLVEGRSHHEIAAARRTSVRTVANQLASAFRRLGVSGRADLLVRLVEHPEGVQRAERRAAATEDRWPPPWEPAEHDLHHRSDPSDMVCDVRLR